ncbi:major allergen I polypeptide chain 1-like [Sigmodon hispidus]
MKLTGAVVLLGAALLLTSGGSGYQDCGICPAIKEDVNLFLTGSVSEYVAFIQQYKNESVILENAENLKKCIDSKLTEEDKANAQSLIVSCLYVCPGCLFADLLTQVSDGTCVHPSHCNFSVNPEI